MKKTKIIRLAKAIALLLLLLFCVPMTTNAQGSWLRQIIVQTPKKIIVPKPISIIQPEHFILQPKTLAHDFTIQGFSLTSRSGTPIQPITPTPGFQYISYDPQASIITSFQAPKVSLKDEGIQSIRPETMINNNDRDKIFSHNPELRERYNKMIKERHIDSTVFMKILEEMHNLKLRELQKKEIDERHNQEWWEYQKKVIEERSLKLGIEVLQKQLFKQDIKIDFNIENDKVAYIIIYDNYEYRLDAA